MMHRQHYRPARAGFSRRAESALDVLTAILIGAGLAWVLIDGLSK